MNKIADHSLNLQPQSDDAERSVLGSMLASKDAVSKSINLLKSHHFYKDAHIKIFSVMVELFDRSEPIDTVSVIDILKKKKE